MFQGTKFTDLDLPQKLCPVCCTEFTQKSGVHKFCSTECKGKWQYISGKNSTENQYKVISGNWDRYFSRLLQCNKQRKTDGLTVELLKELLEKQNYKCALSGIDLTCQLEVGIISKTNASIDRIEAGGPYIKENVQLVCRALNAWRNDTELSEFLWWCKKVTQFRAE